MKSEAMDENLVGYLLKTLDLPTHQEVEAYLRGHPEARARLDLFERALAPLSADAEDPDPPPGLVLGTLARVAEYRCRKLPAAPPPPRQQVGSAGRRWSRRADWLVAASLLILVGGLCVPGILHQWRLYQRQACTDNLRKFGIGLAVYSERHHGAFPRVEPQGAQGVAGIFVPVLREAGVLPADVSVECPAQGKRPAPPISLARLEELYDRPEAFNAAARDLAGGYAYSLGYREGQLYWGLRRDMGDALPILADRPQLGRLDSNSLNHGGGGQNVLYIGGNARWCTNRSVGVDGDDIYLNIQNQVRAGLNRYDTVLGPGDASPFSGAD
jgi:hypothetical protein